MTLLMRGINIRWICRQLTARNNRLDVLIMALSSCVMFPDSDFEEACMELENPNTEGYDFFVESHGVKIYRQYNEVSGLYSYKVYGILDDVSPEICSQVYMDIEYRRTWDNYVNELKEVSEGDKVGTYWQVNFPFPMSNRDYVFFRELKELIIDGKKMFACLAKSQVLESIPEKRGVIRVKDYAQSMALTSDGKVGSIAYMKYYDNPGGMIPTWLINWGAKTGVPAFLSQMQKACRTYPEYLEKKSACS